MVEQVTVKTPNAMTRNELIEAGKSPEDADRIMHERVFGTGFKRDDAGKPIEVGFGSSVNPTSQHTAALQLANDRKLHQNGAAGADVIAQAVAAGVKAGIKHAEEERL